VALFATKTTMADLRRGQLDPAWIAESARDRDPRARALSNTSALRHIAFHFCRRATRSGAAPRELLKAQAPGFDAPALPRSSINKRSLRLAL
jgi:hypothetical protein